MRRSLAVLLLVTACTSGHTKAVPSPTPSGDECQRELKNARIETIVFDARTGKKLDEYRASDSQPMHGLLYGELKLPPVQVPVTDDHPGAYGQRPTVHPPGKPAWTASGRLLAEVNGIALVDGSPPLNLQAVRVSDGRTVWTEGNFTPLDLTVVGVNGNNVVLAEQPGLAAPTLLEVDAKTAWVRWSTKLPRGQRFAVSGGLAISTASAEHVGGHGEIRVLDVNDGRQLWTYRLPLPIALDVTVQGDKVLVDSQTVYYGGCE